MEDIRPGSLHVKLLCFTDERFLEVWADYESGRIKERLQEGFTQSGIELEGLIIEIENLEEVNQTKTDIEIRYSGIFQCLHYFPAGVFVHFTV